MKKFSVLASGLLLAGSLEAQIIAQWTFENSVPAANPGTGVWLTNIAAEVGSGVASGWHSGAAVYTSPAGNGSAHSLSSSNWAIGDLYQFAASSAGYSGLQLEWDQASSGTGPKLFYLFYSLDGSSFTQIGAYTVLANAAPNPTWELQHVQLDLPLQLRCQFSHCIGQSVGHLSPTR
jgi:hypothetical protein